MEAGIDAGARWRDPRLAGDDGQPMRTHFRITTKGKISLTASAPIRGAA